MKNPFKRNNPKLQGTTEEELLKLYELVKEKMLKTNQNTEKGKIEYAVCRQLLANMHR